jgi:hypothetical protein
VKRKAHRQNFDVGDQQSSLTSQPTSYKTLNALALSSHIVFDLIILIRRQAVPRKNTRPPHRAPVAQKHDGRETEQRRNACQHGRGDVVVQPDVHGTGEGEDERARGRTGEDQAGKAGGCVDGVAIGEVAGQRVDVFVQCEADEELGEHRDDPGDAVGRGRDSPGEDPEA